MLKERNIEEYTKQYLNAPFLKQNVEYRRNCVLKQIRKYKHNSILEIGCGMFPLFQYLEGDYDKYYIIEPSQLFCDNADKIIKENLPLDLQGKVTVLQGELEKKWSNVDSVGFDFIICSSLLHEVSDEGSLLGAIHKVADSNTVIHFNVPNAKSFHRILAKEMGMIEDIYMKSEKQKILQQREVYDLDKLKERLMNQFAQGEILSEGSIFIKPFTHEQMSRIYNEEIINDDVLAGLEKMVKYFPEYGSEIYINIKVGGGVI